jgi:hypothetical protein
MPYGIPNTVEMAVLSFKLLCVSYNIQRNASVSGVTQLFCSVQQLISNIESENALIHLNKHKQKKLVFASLFYNLAVVSF